MEGHYRDKDFLCKNRGVLLRENFDLREFVSVGCTRRSSRSLVLFRVPIGSPSKWSVSPYF